MNRAIERTSRMWITEDESVHTVSLPPTYYRHHESVRALVRGLKRKQRARLQEALDDELEFVDGEIAKFRTAEQPCAAGSDHMAEEPVPTAVLDWVDWPAVISSKPDFTSIRAVDPVWRLDVILYLDELL
jgi:hypothetical protein